MQNNLISIIIPIYNRAHLIGETLDSILAQTYTNWECIIVDDRSTDNIEELIGKYIQKDSRFQYYLRPKNKPKGANACRNYGFELSKGDYLKWFDSDDLMHSNFLEKQVVFLKANLEIDFCSSLSKMFANKIDDNLGIFKPDLINDDNSIYNFIIGKLYFLTPSTLWRRSLLTNKELFDEDLYNAHETDFNFRRLIEGARFYYIQDVLFYVRRGHQSIDRESINNPISVKSQFDYFQKVYTFLNVSNSILGNLKISELKKYVIYRQVHFFYDMQSEFSFSDNFKNIKVIFRNLLEVKINSFNFLRVLVGLVIILFLRRGYSIIHIKSFDIRDKLDCKR